MRCHSDTLSPTCGYPPPSRSLVWYATVSFTPQSSYAICPSSDSYREDHKSHYLSDNEHHQCLNQLGPAEAESLINANTRVCSVLEDGVQTVHTST